MTRTLQAGRNLIIVLVVGQKFATDTGSEVQAKGVITNNVPHYDRKGDFTGRGSDWPRGV